jgi:hypothetical protein
MASTVPSPASEATWTDDPRWELVLRVADSSAFAKAPVLRKFLLYVCEQAIRGNAEIKEQQIGCDVFGRPPAYNAAEDNIVRVRAREVRQRLERYFQTEGAHEPLIISIPKGHYVPVFEPRATRATHATAPSPIESPGPRMPARYRRLCYLAAIPFVAALALAFARHRASWTPPSPAWENSSAAYKLFWSQLFDRRQPTLIVVADSNFALWQDLSRRTFNLQAYMDRSYLPRDGGSDPERDRMIAGRQYTSLADINVLTRILQIHPGFPGFTQVRFARHAEIRDFKTRNAILLGSPRSNPWVELFESRLNFLARYDPATGETYFQDAGAKPGAPERFVHNGNSGEDFATVALLRNLANTGWVLILSGLTSSGTEAAGEAVGRPDLCQHLLQAAGISLRGPIIPFEALLRVKAVAGGPADIRIVACRKPRS